MTKGEQRVADLLDTYGIEYETQYSFPGLRDVYPLRFDFFVPYYGACIEFNGRQHYKAIPFFGGEDGLAEIKRKDKIKRDFCKEYGIRLIIVRDNESVGGKLRKTLGLPPKSKLPRISSTEQAIRKALAVYGMDCRYDEETNSFIPYKKE